MKIISLCLVLSLLACGKEEISRLTTQNAELSKALSETQSQLNEANKEAIKIQFLKANMRNVKAKIITDLGDIDVVFYPDLAPLHVYSFITRAESGFYKGTQFHRVMPGFMIQGGDPNSRDNNFNDDGTGGPLVAMPHEFNSVNHKRGILSTARTPDVSAGAGSQFFIMHGDLASLDNQYTVFGEVTKGLEIVDKIAAVPKNEINHPLKAIRIKDVIVTRN